MCHPGLPLVSFREKAVGARWFVLEVMAVAEAINLQGEVVPGDAVSADGVVGSPKKCVCSPTQHPGSFRCRQHQAEYQWGGRLRSQHTTFTTTTTPIAVSTQ